MTAPTRLCARPALWLTALATAAALLSGCSALPSTDRVFGLVTPYKVEVVQGNVITKEQAALIKPGQTRAQVRDILGSPLLMGRVPRRPMGLCVHHPTPGRRAPAAPGHRALRGRPAQVHAGPRTAGRA